MKSPDLDVRYVARLARLELTDEEAAAYQAQLSQVLDYAARLNALDVSGIEPTLHAQEVHNRLRPDHACAGFSPEEALANAPVRSGSQFLTVRVVE